MTPPTTAKQLADYIPTDAHNLRNQLKGANGQIHFNAETDELSPEQLAVWLPRYLNGRGQFKGEKRERVEALLANLSPIKKAVQPQPKARPNTNQTPRQPDQPRPTKAEQLQQRIDELELELSQWQGQPKVMRLLGSSNARVAVAVLLAAFELVGTVTLLAPKGKELAYPVGIAMACALLVFTASNNKPGQWFCIGYAFVLGGLYFGILPSDLTNWLFAFVPPTVTAIIVNSFNQKK